MRDLATVVAATVVAWAVFALPAILLLGQSLEVTVFAAIVALVPNLVLLAAVVAARRTAPSLILMALLASFVLRPFATFALGLMVHAGRPAVQGSLAAFALWTAGFYLVLLAVESTLVYRQEMAARGNGHA